MPFPIGVPLKPRLYLQPFSRYSAPDRARAHTHTHTHTHKLTDTQTHAASDLYAVPCSVLHWTDKNQNKN